jgi:hypothetical protein
LAAREAMSRGARFPKLGYFSLEIIIAIRIVDLIRWFGAVLDSFRDPDASIVAQRFGHQGQFRLMVTGNGNAGGMNLGETGITEERAAFVGAISGGDIATSGVGRKKKTLP